MYRLNRIEIVKENLGSVSLLHIILAYMFVLFFKYLIK